MNFADDSLKTIKKSLKMLFASFSITYQPVDLPCSLSVEKVKLGND